MKQVQYVSGAIVALAILMGQVQVFGADANYVGHGEFTDHGSDAGVQQFWLDLGQVNLNQNGEYEFNISGLPSVEFYTQILLGMKH